MYADMGGGVGQIKWKEIFKNENKKIKIWRRVKGKNEMKNLIENLYIL